MNTSSLDYYITPQIYADDCPVLSYFSWLSRHWHDFRNDYFTWNVFWFSLQLLQFQKEFVKILSYIYSGR